MDHLSIQKLLRRISSDFYLDLQFYIDTNKYDSRVDDMMNKTDSIYVECINKSNFGINIRLIVIVFGMIKIIQNIIIFVPKLNTLVGDKFVFVVLHIVIMVLTKKFSLNI